jgi:hypothetical protein
MKKIFTLLAAISLAVTGWAQSPEKMSYQAVIRNADDQLVTTQVGMRISILQGSAAGTSVFVERQTPTPNANGLVTIEIGSGTPVTGTISLIDWSAGPYFIKTETDLSGGTTYTISGTSQLLSVPYALFAKKTAGRYIGELYGGGIIVSVWEVAGVQHGLIASLTDLAGPVAWSDVIDVQVYSQSPIDGQANTDAIVAQSIATSAADLCNNYTNPETGTGVYSDWYLPAIWELNKCYQAVLIVNHTLPPADGFVFNFYWSSTETDATQAWYHGFHTNLVGSNALKANVAGYVRAVRDF